MSIIYHLKIRRSLAINAGINKNRLIIIQDLRDWTDNLQGLISSFWCTIWTLYRTEDVNVVLKVVLFITCYLLLCKYTLL